MAEAKTKATEGSVDDFLAAVADESKREDCRELMRLMERITGEPPRMWGASMVGFGSYHYRYDSGREGDWFLTGFSPRKNELSVYITSGFAGFEQLLSRLGRHHTGKSCLYIRRLADVDQAVLAELIESSVQQTVRTYGRS